MKHSAEYEAFTNLLDRVLSVPHEDIKRRESEYRRRADADLPPLSSTAYR